MPDPKQLPYMFRLLDDDSAVVRTAVLREFQAFGPSLEGLIARLSQRPEDHQLKQLGEILRTQRRSLIRQDWGSWMNEREEKKKLESAMVLLARIELGTLQPRTLGGLLDDFAEEYRRVHARPDVLTLAKFLFRNKQLQGCLENEYYDPANSNLIAVIERRRGIPLSLCVIYILVGSRLGLEIEGCNFPGHFLAVATLRRQNILVDCYNGGRILTAASLEQIGATISLEDILRLKCHAVAIITRALRNLTAAYERADDGPAAEFASDLLAMMPAVRVASSRTDHSH